jgi:hypothetical protein
VFLLCPAMVGELIGLGPKGARLGEEVPLDDISMGVTRVMFCAHLPMHECKGCQAFLPCNNGTLLAIQLPL